MNVCKYTYNICVFLFTRVPPTASTDITPTDTVLLSTNADFSAVAESGTDSATLCSTGDVLPTQDDVVRKTDRITKRLQELFLAAQEGNRTWYAFQKKIGSHFHHCCCCCCSSCCYAGQCGITVALALRNKLSYFVVVINKVCHLFLMSESVDCLLQFLGMC